MNSSVTIVFTIIIITTTITTPSLGCEISWYDKNSEGYEKLSAGVTWQP
jgi:hypothetical protein